MGKQRKNQQGHGASHQPRNQPKPHGTHHGKQQVMTAGIASNSQPLSNSQQGEYCYDCAVQEGVNIYQLVDSWRSYRNDQLTGNSLQSLHHHPAQTARGQPAYSTLHQGVQSGHLDATAPAFQPALEGHPAKDGQASFTPYLPLRARMNWSNVQINPDATQRPWREDPPSLATDTSHNSRYSFRKRRVDQVAPYSTSVDVSSDIPLPSVEGQGDVTILTTAKQAGPDNGQGRRSRSTTPWYRDVKPPPPPKATKIYMRQAALDPERRDQPKKLLVILDLNGTILVRPHRKSDPQKANMRPGVHALLEYLFQNHIVMIYSSARPENTEGMVKNFMHPTQRKKLAAIWSRDKLDLTSEQYNAKVQVYKKLDKIWRDTAIQATAEPNSKWDQTNTILVDDSYLKALAQPHNLLRVPEFENNAPRTQGPELYAWMKKEKAILKSLEERLEDLKWQVDVSRLIRQWQAGTTSAPGAIDEEMDAETQDMIQRQVEPSPAPGVDPNATTPQCFSRQSPELAAVEEMDETDGGVSIEQHEQTDHGNLLTELKGDKTRSVSPVTESTFRELLGMDGECEEEKKVTDKGLPPMAESMGA